MHARQRHSLRVISSVLMGIMAFIVGLLLTIFAGVILFFFLQEDFLLVEVIVAFLMTCAVAGLISGVIVGVRYYQRQGKLKGRC